MSSEFQNCLLLKKTSKHGQRVYDKRLIYNTVYQNIFLKYALNERKWSKNHARACNKREIIFAKLLYGAPESNAN